MFIEFFMHIIHAKKINRNKCQFQCFVLFNRDTRAIEIMIRSDRCYGRVFSLRSSLLNIYFCFHPHHRSNFFFNLLHLKHFSDLRNMDFFDQLLPFIFKFFFQFLPLLTVRQIEIPSKTKETYSDSYNFDRKSHDIII